MIEFCSRLKSKVIGRLKSQLQSCSRIEFEISASYKTRPIRPAEIWRQCRMYRTAKDTK